MPKKEKKISVSLSFPDYKLEALALALEEKGVSLEEELEQYLAKLYQKKSPQTCVNTSQGSTKSTSRPRWSRPKRSRSGSRNLILLIRNPKPIGNFILTPKAFFPKHTRT